jgi:hypothetical protein
MAEKSEELQWRVMGTLGAVAAAWVAKRLMNTTWTAVTGNEPPSNPESPETTWKEAVGWAVLSGVILGLARLVATRQAAKVWEKRKGSRPPGLEKVA